MQTTQEIDPWTNEPIQTKVQTPDDHWMTMTIAEAYGFRLIDEMAVIELRKNLDEKIKVEKGG